MKVFGPALVLSMFAAIAPAHAQAGAFGTGGVGVRWTVADQHLKDFAIVDRLHRREIAADAPFTLTFADGRTLSAADMVLDKAPVVRTIAGSPAAPRLSERTARREVSARFVDPARHLRVDWSIVQGANTAYLRQVVTVTALDRDAAITRIDLLPARIAGATVNGSVDGSPVVTGDDYLQFEHPLSKASADADGKVRLWIDRALPLLKGRSASFSIAAGVTRPGQLRRDFLAYVEAERAHPYRTFLHYNSWYDIGYFTPYTEVQALDRINTFGTELTVKRKVKLDSFLFDDGWDDRSGSWNMAAAFPRGFLPLRDAAAKYGAAPGIWLSPWGGYSKPKVERVTRGTAAGYETIDGGFALSGPRYYDRFHSVVLDLLKREGINQFKFDGTGNASQVVPGSRFNSDFDAAIQLIEDLRAAKPGLFINLTTGTYPSPAWLRYADTIWRGAEDHDFAGTGTWRQRWITYRDAMTYQETVRKGPLFPITALMLHGIIYAQHAKNLDSDPGHDFADEVHSYFGTGTELQELYVTPSLLTPADWDTLAAAARWSRANADVLADNHWIGGDPGKGEVYGWAAWSPRKAIVTVRNPGDRAQSFTLDLVKALELSSDGGRHRFHAAQPWGNAATPDIADASRPLTIDLKPFEVRTIEFTPY